jgi:hypothetical protein
VQQDLYDDSGLRLARSELHVLRIVQRGERLRADALNTIGHGYARAERFQLARVEPASYVLSAKSRMAFAGSDERRTAS